MKAFTFLFASVFIFNAVSQPVAQESSVKSNLKWKFGAETMWIVNTNLNVSQGFAFATSFTAQLNQHQFAAGPLWWVDRNKTASPFRGGIFCYQYTPHQVNRWITFHLAYTLVYSFESTDWSRYMQYASYNYHYVKYNEHWDSLKNLIGYGLKLKLYKNWYLKHEMSLGYEFYDYSSQTDVTDNPSLSGKYSSGNIFTNGNITSLIKMGIAYHFE